MIIFLIIIIGLPLLGWYAFTGAFDALTGHNKDDFKPSKDTYITHVHNDNRQVHYHQTNQETEVLEQ